MAFNPSSPTGQDARRVELHLMINQAKAEMDAKMGEIVTGLNSNVVTVDNAMRDLDSKGKALVELVDKQRAEIATQVQQVMADAGSEFEETQDGHQHCGGQRGPDQERDCSHDDRPTRGIGFDKGQYPGP